MGRACLPSMMLVASLFTSRALAQDARGPFLQPPVPSCGEQGKDLLPLGEKVSSLPPLQPDVTVPAEERQDFSPSKEENSQPLQSFYVAQAPVNRTRMYGGAEYLLWWMKKGDLPILVTQGDPADTPTGSLDRPGTTILFGGDRYGPSGFSGGRFTLGLWLDSNQTLALEGSFFFLAQRGLNFQVSGDGDPAGKTTLNVPFFNADGSFEDASQVVLPRIQSGTIAVMSSHRFLGTEVNIRKKVRQADDYRVSLLCGFRYLSLDEGLGLEARSDALPVGLGLSASFSDSFATRNRFYGGQVGIDLEAMRGRWVLNAQTKLGIGGMSQRVSISGTTITTDPISGTVATAGGLFTGQTNDGVHARSRFVFVPEVGVNLGYQLTDSLAATVGYTFLYASSIARSGDQVDRSVNLAPPTTRPAFTFQASDFWIQGINVGVTLRY